MHDVCTFDSEMSMSARYGGQDMVGDI